MHRLQLALQLVDQLPDPLDGERVKRLPGEAAVMIDFLPQLFAPLAHGSPLGTGREHEMLSVIDGCLETGDDDINDSRYVRFRTLDPLFQSGLHLPQIRSDSPTARRRIAAEAD